MGRHSKYPAEFRRESVLLVLTTDKSTAEVSRDLGINYKTLGNSGSPCLPQSVIEAIGFWCH